MYDNSNLIRDCYKSSRERYFVATCAAIPYFVMLRPY